MIHDFEQRIKQDLHTYLVNQGTIETLLPDAPDIEGKWEAVAQSYLPDGIREFTDYPTVSLGWMMYIGMAVAQMWDTDWTHYDNIDDLYTLLRDPRGYDCMDEYIREDILGLTGEEYDATERLVSACAKRTLSNLQHSGYEAGTRDAFLAYVACLHQLYLMGAAIQLRWMGYRMEKV